MAFLINMAEEQGFEPWVGYKPTPVFKTGALNHSATPPNEAHNISKSVDCKALTLNYAPIVAITLNPLDFASHRPLCQHVQDLA